MKTPLQRLIFTLCICLLVLLSGCGLPVIITLNMPEYVAPSSGVFSFKADIDNNETEFRGFELYYKISSVAGDNDLKSLDELLANGFKRVSRASPPQESKNALDKPLIAIELADRGSDYTVTIDFTGLADATETDLEALDPGEPDISVSLASLPDFIVIRRGVTYTDVPGSEDIFKRFNEIADGDGDISNFSAIESGLVPLALYVLSFGRAADFTDVYSVPLFLGINDIVFPTVS
jgi:hypothetical protein